jgi:predicted RNA-binding protein with EMAP domain
MLSRSVVTNDDVEAGKYDDWADQFEESDQEIEALNEMIEDMNRRERNVNIVLNAIRQASPHLHHADVHQILVTLACAMHDCGRFNPVEVANVEDTADDY